MNERGSALLQVLVTAVVAALICASIIRTRMQPALTAANAIQRVSDDAAEQGSINRVHQVWLAADRCSSDTTLPPLGPGVSCVPSAALPTCSCVCSVAGLGTVTSQPQAGGGCALTVAMP